MHDCLLSRLVSSIHVVSFKTFTEDYHACCEYLKANAIKSVAMEATGGYWMSLYEMLEQHGVHVCLVRRRLEPSPNRLSSFAVYAEQRVTE
jgi:transposase